MSNWKFTINEIASFQIRYMYATNPYKFCFGSVGSVHMHTFISYISYSNDFNSAPYCLQIRNGSFRDFMYCIIKQINNDFRLYKIMLIESTEYTMMTSCEYAMWHGYIRNIFI